MRIPRYWARAEEQTPPEYDAPRRITVWGWSHDSRIEAERHAIDIERFVEALDDGEAERHRCWSGVGVEPERRAGEPA